MAKALTEAKYEYLAATLDDVRTYDNIGWLELRWLREVLGATKNTIEECYLELGTATNVPECMLQVWVGEGATGDNFPEIAYSLFNQPPPPPLPTGGDGLAWETTVYGTAMALSEGNTVATWNGGNWEKRYGDTGSTHATGKWVYEVTYNQDRVHNTNDMRFGISRTRLTTQVYGQTTSSFAYLGDGRFYNNNVATAVDADMISGVTGDTVMIVADLDNLTFGVIPSSTGVYTVYAGALPASKIWFTGMGMNGGGQCTTNWGAANFVNTKPAGFSAWDGGTA